VRPLAVQPVGRGKMRDVHVHGKVSGASWTDARGRWAVILVDNKKLGDQIALIFDRRILQRREIEARSVVDIFYAWASTRSE
jgi:hypothetical protein